MAHNSRCQESIIVTGGQGAAEVLNGVYIQIGNYCDRPHYAKDGLPYDLPRDGLPENLQIWWHDGEWRVGNTGDHWFVLPVDTQVLPEGAWCPDRSRGVKTPITIIRKRWEREENKFIAFAAGAISGLVADAVTHPIDTVRTRLWVQGATTAAVQSTGGSSYTYGGLFNGFYTMLHKEGVGSLYKGFGSVALLTPLAHGLYFGSYEWAKRRLIREDGNLGGINETAAILCAGFFANSVGALVWNPMDVVKQQQQATVEQRFTGPVDGLRRVYAAGGFRNGLMRGYTTGLATYGPFSAIYFLTYERFKKFCLGHTNELRTQHYVAGGAVAGSVAAVLTAPMDLVKTRRQVCDRYKEGALLTAQRIVREEGFAVFVKGIGARVTWVAPGCAITIAIFEDVGSFLSKHLASAAPPLPAPTSSRVQVQ